MTAVKRLPLNALRVFEAVARTGSMAKAAEDLNVQPSAVSMQIQNLTDYIGVPLFNRQGRGLELSKHGAMLLPKMSVHLRALEASVDSIRSLRKSSPLVITMLPSFLHQWIMPRLHDFEARHPEISLQILTGRDLVDLSKGEVSAAIRLGRGTWANVDAVKLMDEWLLPVATPKLFKKFGALKLGRLNPAIALIHSVADPWSLWTGEQSEPKIAVSIDDSLAIIHQALRGKGYALVRWSLVQQELTDATLLRAGNPQPYRFAYYWVTPANRNRDERLLVFADWLKEQLGQPT